MDGFRGKVPAEPVFMGQLLQILLNEFDAVQLRRAEKGGVIGGDMGLLRRQIRTVQLEKAVNALHGSGTVELVRGREQRLFQLPVEGVRRLQLAHDALLPLRIQLRQRLFPQPHQRRLRRGRRFQGETCRIEHRFQQKLRLLHREGAALATAPCVRLPGQQRQAFGAETCHVPVGYQTAALSLRQQ